jgi:hypothetical protein
MLFNKPQLMLAPGLVMCVAAKAQDSSRLQKALFFPDKLFVVPDKKIPSIEQKLNKQNNRYLKKLQSQEYQLRREPYSKDAALDLIFYPNNN